MRKFKVHASVEARKRRILASSEYGDGCTPPSLAKWYYEGTRQSASAWGFDVDFIGSPSIRNEYADEGYEWVGFILAKPEYFDVLEDCGIGFLDVVVDPQNGELIAVQYQGGRVFEVDDNEVIRTLG